MTPETEQHWCDRARELTVRGLKEEPRKAREVGSGEAIPEEPEEQVRVSFDAPPLFKAKWDQAVELFRKLEGRDDLPVGAAAEAFAAEWRSGVGAPAETGECREVSSRPSDRGSSAESERQDMQRILDWAMALPETDDEQHVLMMGNSGGGMVTIYTAACDERITIAVPSCSFAPSTSPAGYIFHCDCNMVPGLLEFGDFCDVAGLISPRHLLAVSGHGDTLFPESSLRRAADRVEAVYQASGCPERFDHRWGDDGHRFYKHLMWPFVLDALKTPK